MHSLTITSTYRSKVTSILQLLWTTVGKIGSKAGLCSVPPLVGAYGVFETYNKYKTVSSVNAHFNPFLMLLKHSLKSLKYDVRSVCTTAEFVPSYIFVSTSYILLLLI